MTEHESPESIQPSDRAEDSSASAPQPQPAVQGGYPGPVPVPHAADTRKAGLSKRTSIAIIGAALVVVVAIASAFIWQALTRAEAATDRNPSEWVEGYLTALSEGDAEAALPYVHTQTHGAAMLTDAVLRSSLAQGAIENIATGEETKDEYGDVIVPATFTIGEDEVSRDFTVSVGSDGDMTIVDGLIDISPFGFDGMGLTVNGSPAPAEITLFPGAYEFAVTVPNFAIEGESRFLLVEREDTDALNSMTPTLSDQGTAVFRELVAASVQECLAMMTLSTPCGLDVSVQSEDGYTPVDGTVTRTLTAEGASALAALEPRISADAVVTASEGIDVAIRLQGENADGARAWFTVVFGSALLSPKVDFAAEVPSVVWE